MKLPKQLKNNRNVIIGVVVLLVIVVLAYVFIFNKPSSSSAPTYETASVTAGPDRSQYGIYHPFTMRASIEAADEIKSILAGYGYGATTIHYIDDHTIWYYTDKIDNLGCHEVTPQPGYGAVQKSGASCSFKATAIDPRNNTVVFEQNYLCFVPTDENIPVECV